MSSSGTTATTTTTSESLALQFLLHDGSGTPKPSFILKALKSSLATASLTDLRAIIAGSPQQKEFALYTFCSKDGASLPDTYSLKDTVALYGSKLETDQGLIPFYIRAPPVSRSSSASTSQIAAPTLDTTKPTNPDLIASAALAAQTSSYAAARYTAAASLDAGASSSRASDLKEADWFVVAQNNALHRAYVVDRQKQAGSTTAVNATGLSNARRTAFQFKKREIPNFSVSGSGTVETMLSLRVPNFVVDDQSYVSVYETSNTFQASLAESSFSELDVKASVSGGAFGYSVGVAASYSQSSSSATASASMSAANRMHISYNFPRVLLVLDEESLELTDQCKRDVASVVDLSTMKNFLNLYGQFFPTRVQLGGRLFASDESSTVTGSNASEKARTMKAAAAVSFSSSFVSGSVSAGYGTASNTAQSGSSSSFSSSLSWQATGGDTLLCNDPASWCPTVAPFYSWRITRQDQVTHILDLIGNMPGYSALPSQWRALDTPATTTTPIVVPTSMTFTLLSSRTDVADLNLSVFTPSQWSLASSEKERKDAVPTQGTASADMTDMAKYGTIADYNAAANDANSGNLWQVEGLDGSIVSQPKFETPYIMKCPSVGYYVAWRWNPQGKHYWSATSYSRYPIIFKNPTGSTTASNITDGTRVSIFVCTSSTDQATGNFAQILISGSISSNYVLMGTPTTKATWTVRVRTPR